MLQFAANCLRLYCKLQQNARCSRFHFVRNMLQFAATIIDAIVLQFATNNCCNFCKEVSATPFLFAANCNNLDCACVVIRRRCSVMPSPNKRGTCAHLLVPESGASLKMGSIEKQQTSHYQPCTSLVSHHPQRTHTLTEPQRSEHTSQTCYDMPRFVHTDIP